MGEYVWTEMYVGGKAAKATIDALEALFADHFESDIIDLETALEARQPRGAGGLANYGNPEEIVSFCETHNLTFQASWCGQSGVFDAGICFWNPEMAVIDEVVANDAGEPVITLWELRHAEQSGKPLAEIISELDRARFKHVPPLELIP